MQIAGQEVQVQVPGEVPEVEVPEGSGADAW